MTKAKLQNRIRYALQFLPITLNAVILGIVVALAYPHLVHADKKVALAINAHYALVDLMVLFLFWLFLALLAISFLSTVGAYAYFFWLRKNEKTSYLLNFTTVEKKKGKQQYLEITLPHALRPMLGAVKGRIVYDNKELSDKFSLSGAIRKPNSLLRQALFGKCRIALPDIKEYQIVEVFIFFEDMLHLFSLPIGQKMQQSFFQSPKLFAESITDIAPKKTDTMDIRIQEMRKVEGDLLNYKDFESGDDVRRIVWKVFAKNRDLVVRIPERMEPFASHLYLYASFYNQFAQYLGNAYFAEMLNQYKSEVWSIYKSIAQQGWQLKFVPDQTFHLADAATDEQKNERIISNCQWQKENPLSSYFTTQRATVLIISSLTDPAELAQILNNAEPSLKIIFVKLSPIFSQYVALHWLKNLFFLPAPDRLSKLRNRWLFSPIRRQILKNEKAIDKLLATHN